MLATCTSTSAADIDKAVATAKKAFPTWATTSAAERAALLLKIADIIDEHAAELAKIETRDNGKCMILVDGTVARGSDIEKYLVSALMPTSPAATSCAALTAVCPTARLFVPTACAVNCRLP